MTVGDREDAKPRRRPWRLEDLFGIDLRSLALFRICLGLLLLVDLACRFPYIDPDCTDPGILPRELLPLRLSLHALGGSHAFEAALFAAAAVFAGMLIAGWRTRLATVFSWLLLTSLHLRNTRLLDGGDGFCRLLLFWSIFLPLGARWSLDGRGAPRPGAGANRVFSVASAAILLQFAFLYLQGGLCKLGPEWLSSGTALEMILQNDYWNRPLAGVLVEHPRLLRVMTPLVVLFEIGSPLLLFLSARRGPLRMAVIAAFWLFQLSLGAAIDLHLFPFFSSLGTLLFVPRWAWEKLHLATAAPEGIPATAGEQSHHARPLLPAARDAVLLVLLAFAFLQNLHNLEYLRLPLPFMAFADTVLFTQRWQMYSRPPATDVSFRIEGTTEDGQIHDLLRLPGEYASRLRRLHARYRFKYYLERLLRTPETEDLRAAYATWMRRAWNARVGEGPQLRRVRLIEVSAPIAPKG